MLIGSSAEKRPTFGEAAHRPSHLKLTAWASERLHGMIEQHSVHIAFRQCT